MSGEEKMRCYNRGCGKEYTEKENASDVCAHHPGTPVFHDALKGWSCCQRRVTDFTEFLNIPGCTRSKHSNLKPPEPKVKPHVSNEALSGVYNTEKPALRKPEIKKQEPRPKNLPVEEKVSFDGEVYLQNDNLPFKRLNVVVSDSLKKALKINRECMESNKEDDSENGVIQKGTSCKNNACSSVYKDESSNSENCLFHPGNPVFHEGYKFWSCCLRRTSDFNEFLKQKGCTNGSHVWFLTDEQKKKAVACRFDYYEIGSSIVVSVYAKLCDPEKCFVDANQTCIRGEFVFGIGSKFELDLKLHGYVELLSAPLPLNGLTPLQDYPGAL